MEKKNVTQSRAHAEVTRSAHISRTYFTTDTVPVLLQVTFPSMDSYAYSARSDLGFSLFLDRRCKIVYFIGKKKLKKTKKGCLDFTALFALLALLALLAFMVHKYRY